MKAFYSLIAVLVFNLVPALATQVTLSYSSPLKIGQETTVKANVTDATGLEGAVLSVIYDGAQDSEATQIDLGKIGDAKLEAKFIPTSQVRRVTVRYAKDGRNYSNVAEGDTTQSKTFDFTHESSRAYAPFIQFGLWFLAFGAMGAWSLRNAKGAF